jgi:hypothetical protein
MEGQMKRAALLQERRMQKFRDVLSRWEAGGLSLMDAGELLGITPISFPIFAVDTILHAIAVTYQCQDNQMREHFHRLKQFPQRPLSHNYSGKNNSPGKPVSPKVRFGMSATASSKAAKPPSTITLAFSNASGETSS